ncbi:hypothetical protein HUU42_02330 [bacterium]|nr:hypothetical protein [bacterium]
MATSRNSELEKIEELLKLDIRNKPNDHFVKTFLRQVEHLSPSVLKTFRTNLSSALIEREGAQKGHLKIEAMMQMLDFSKFQVWLTENGISDKSARNIIEGLQIRSTEETGRIVHSESYHDYERKEISELLMETDVGEEDAATFMEVVENTELSVGEIIQRIFKLNYMAENAARQEALRGRMSLKEIVVLYLHTVLQVVISEYGLDEEMILEITNRIALSNNMKRQFMIVQQLERYFFGLSTHDMHDKGKDFWVRLINEYELKIALEQYITQDKVEKSDMEIAELYAEAHHLFDDVSELKDETLAIISITYRLDNPEERGHSAEELLAIIDQIKLLTKEFSPLMILTRDIFSFFEILGECDHHNRFFRETILKFRLRLKKLADAKEKAGDRITLANLVLTYLYSRLDAYLDEYDVNEESVLEGIRNRLSQCNDFERQFAIVDLIEDHIFANPGLLQIVDGNYWPELINTFELNIILEIYVRRGYLIAENDSMTKNQMLDHVQSRINNIDDIVEKSLTVTFLTAQLSALLDQSKENRLTIAEVTKTIDHLHSDAAMAAKQLQLQSHIKRELLSVLTERVFRLETIQKAFDGQSSDLISRLDEVTVGFRTRRDNLIEGKMDPKVLEEDIRQYLNDTRVVGLIEEAEKEYKEQLQSHGREKSSSRH